MMESFPMENVLAGDGFGSDADLLREGGSGGNAEGPLPFGAEKATGAVS